MLYGQVEDGRSYLAFAHISLDFFREGGGGVHPKHVLDAALMVVHQGSIVAVTYIRSGWFREGG